MRPIASCDQCMVGAVSGVGQGLFCPLIERHYGEGDILYQEGDSASYIWFIKVGMVELSEASSDTDPRRKGPGSFLGLEAMVRDQYDATARFVTAGSLCGATRAGFARWLGPQHERTCVLLRDLLELEEPA